MGGTYWSDDRFRERQSYRRTHGEDAFEYNAVNARLPASERRVHQKMEPFGVTVRESRDSDAHPNSHAVAVLFDVTGSMNQVPRILQENLCQLMGLLSRKSHLTDPQVLIGAVGDATCDRAPLQVGQFESGIEIDDNLARLWLEGGGGGQQTESYELGMYFLARKTSIDCHEKRGQRGYLFLIGDEMPYPYLKRKEVEAVIGDRLQADIPVEALVSELKTKYDTYFILPNLTSNYRDPKIFRRWERLLGKNVLRLPDPEGVSELIATTIGLAETSVEFEDVDHDHDKAEGEGIAHAVSRALAPWVKAAAGMILPPLETDPDRRLL